MGKSFYLKIYFKYRIGSIVSSKADEKTAASDRNKS